MTILGSSGYDHDSAAAVLCDREPVAAAQVERFSRKKHDARFPARAIRCCLDETGALLADRDYIVFHDTPLTRFDRLLETCLAYAPKSFQCFVAAMSVWLEEKLYPKTVLRREVADVDGCDKI